MTLMREVQQILDFYSTIEDDSRIGLKHISLYMALFCEYITASSQFPIYVNRDRLMIISKMSRKTYNKCLKELQEYGYIKYEPSCDPAKRSQVFLNKL
jgi:hypothetical protein